MTRTEAEDFLFQEGRLLDEGRWRDWRRLFTDEAIYWIPANAHDIDPLQHCSIVYDDMDLLDERLGRLESGMAWAQIPPSTTLHQISNVMVEASGGDEASLFSNLALFEYRDNAQLRLQPVNVYPAHCHHRLERVNGAWKIKLKKVNLLNCNGELTNLVFLI